MKLTRRGRTSIIIEFEKGEEPRDLEIALECAMSDFRPEYHAVSEHEVKAARDFVTELGKVNR